MVENIRIDFLISGKDAEGKNTLSIIELKQWTEIKFSDLQDHVLTRLGGGLSDERHSFISSMELCKSLKKL